MRLKDWTISAGILLLIVFITIAIGGTLPAVYVGAEAMIFAMVGLWVVELWRATEYPLLSEARALALPMVGLAVYILLQLAPLPPSLIRAISPRTYQVYARAFAGWPQLPPYREWPRTTRTSPAPAPRENDPQVLPSLAEVKAGAAIPFAPLPGKESTGAPSASIASGDAKPRGLRAAVEEIYGTRWRPLSMSPPLTWGALIVFVACGSLFMVAGFFPIGGIRNYRAELTFLRVVIVGLMGVGTMVAALGLVQYALWNGKILWIYQPHDWGAPGFFEDVRASGPFVNPDHFAGYLAMLYPIALSGVLFRSAIVSNKWSAGFRVVCATSAFLIFVAVLLSQSRAGWIGIAVGTTLVVALANSRASAREDGQAGFGYWRVAKIALGTLAAMLVFAMVFVGADSMVQTGLRVHTSLGDVHDVAGRLDGWKAGARMVRDFPLTGVGLGSWPEIFAHYARAPWTENSFYEAENDYLQYFSETGIIGVILGGWLVWRIAGLIARKRASLSSRMRPIEAALLAGIAAMAVIEFFDFDLQLAANAFLFAAILGLAVRIACRHEEKELPVEARSQASRVSFLVKPEVKAANAEHPSDFAQARKLRRFAGLAGATAGLFMVACLLQPRDVYPYNLASPRSWADARHLLIFHPANPYAHAALGYYAVATGKPIDAAVMREAETTVWLDPTSPTARDTYANRLWSQDKTEKSLEQIARSVYNAPYADTHPYLAPRVLVWLAPSSREAIEEGYKRALDAGFEGARTNLGFFYETLGRYDDEALIYKQAAEREQDPDAKYGLLVQAGRSSALAREEAQAQALLRQALEIDPSRADAYNILIADVFGQTDDVAGIRRTASEAIKNGVDPYQVWSKVATAEFEMNQYKAAEDALITALKYRPGSIDDMVRLANLYLLSGDHDSAVSVMQKAVRIRNNNANAYYTLAMADEAAYNYADAGEAYSRAVTLEPKNVYFQQRYADFKKRLEKSAKENSEKDSSAAR